MTHMRGKGPTLLITMGDPAGVGPEVTLLALANPAVFKHARLAVVGDAAHLRRVRHLLAASRGARAGELPEIRLVAHPREIGPEPAAYVLDLANVPAGLPFGRVDARAGDAAVRYVETAVRLCLEGAGDGIVTAPLNKEAMHRAGYRFAGHTELLAKLCGVPTTRMMLVAGSFRVVHVTTHVAMAEAVRRISEDRVYETLRIADEGLRRLGLQRPRLAVAGLNPHAGENGAFGDEELRCIRPAIDRARTEGIEATGPWPGDTVFLAMKQGRHDAVIAMYHDQGHIPVKLLGFDDGVNVTLGLPIVRTSVDHGTAFDIAGQGLARADSMLAAIRLGAGLAAGAAAAAGANRAGAAANRPPRTGGPRE